MLLEMKPKVKIDFLYGDEDWMQPDGASRLSKDFPNINVHQVPNSGHQLLFDNAKAVCKIIKESI